MNIINKEFGSDFNFTKFKTNSNPITFHDKSIFFGCGRYAISHLIRFHLFRNEWKTIYIPEYYCYEVVKTISNTGINIKFYNDSPYQNDEYQIANLKFEIGDVLLRINYFGIRKFRNNSMITIPVIEDHTHSIFSEWAINSNADWCIASLRKCFPVPDGGVLWSPKLHNIELPILTPEHQILAKKRFNAMKLKTKYLTQTPQPTLKDKFLEIFRTTENLFCSNKNSAISTYSIDLLSKIPNEIEGTKTINYHYLYSLIKKKEKIAFSKDYILNPFSFVLLFDTKTKRDKARQFFIKKNVYPAILWHIENVYVNSDTNLFSNQMLSLHIDYRYSKTDLDELSIIINQALNI